MFLKSARVRPYLGVRYSDTIRGSQQVSQTCRAPGCAKPRAGYSVFCEAHRRFLARHGDIRHRPLTSTEARPWATSVTRFITARKAWPSQEKLWEALLTDSRRLLAAYAGGSAEQRFDVEAAEVIVKVSAEADAKTAIATIAGLALMWCERPQRFVSDRAYFFTIARRFRALGTVAAGQYWSKAGQRLRWKYTELAPRTMVALGALLHKHLGIVGMGIHRAMNEQQKRRRKEADEALAALSSPAPGD
jgi:hypothetical protein